MSNADRRGIKLGYADCARSQTTVKLSINASRTKYTFIAITSNKYILLIFIFIIFATYSNTTD